MTHLRQRMLDELQRRNYSQKTAAIYLHAVEDFAKYFHRSDERLGRKGKRPRGWYHASHEQTCAIPLVQ